ncbi:MAG TPA: MATE family efflux transporter [Firmicutes bacterium]|nr:MATE family efflux transporter [Bacillota bacterium]
MNDIRSEVLKLAWPAMLEMILHMFLSMIDTAMVSRLGAGALSATALAGQIYWSVAFVTGALGVGTTALAARAYGARDYTEFSRVAHEGVALAILGGISGFCILRASCTVLPGLISMDSEVELLAMEYIQVMSFGLPPFVVWMVGNAVMRSGGDAVSPLIVAAIANSLNVVGDWILIFGKLRMPAMGVRGAALASVVSLYVAALLSLNGLARNGLGFCSVLRGRWSWRWSTVKELISLSVPASFETILSDGARSVQMVIMSSLGKFEFAAHQIAVTCESLSFMPGYGFAVASTVLVGQRLGARERERAHASAMECMRLSLLTMGAIGLLFIFVPSSFTRVFTDDLQVLVPASRVLRIAGYIQPFIGMTDTLAGALRGAGDTRSPLRITALGGWLVRIPLTLIAVRVLGWSLISVWVINGLEWVLKAVLCWNVFRSWDWSPERGVEG